MLRKMNEHANVMSSTHIGSKDGGRILIEVSLSKQGMPNSEITHIIQEILEFNNEQLEVEKVVMPIGANTWHIRKTRNVRQDSDSDRRPHSGSADSLRSKRKRLQHNRSVAKHCKLHRGKASGKAKKRRAECVTAEDCATNKSDLSEVHSSPAITNLLSQLYPNPYDLMSVLGMHDSSEDSGSEKLSVVENFKVKFNSQKKASSVRESEEEMEVEAEVLQVEPETKVRRPSSKRTKSNEGRPPPAESPPLELPKRDQGEQTEGHGVLKKEKSTWKVSKKRPPTTPNPAQEETDWVAGAFKRERTRMVEEPVSDGPQNNESKEKRKRSAEEKPSVLEYLKLIKNMYEEEERQIQSKMGDAYFNYSLTKKDTYRTKSKESSSMRKKSKKSTDDRGREEAIKVGGDASARNATEDFCGQTTTFEDDRKAGTVALRRADKHVGFNFPANNTCDVLRTDTYVFTRKQPSSDSLPIEVINKNVLETNRKIDLLIRHIDNSMSWLSQSERTEALHMESLVEKARDLSDNLERNLRSYRQCNSLAGTSRDCFPGSDVVVGKSYHSLRIFPVDSGIGSVRISTETLYDEGVWWRSDIVPPASLGNLVAGPHIMDVVTPTTSVNVSEVPELPSSSQPMLTSVEWSNELGSLNESVNQNGSYKIRRKRDSSKASLSDVKSALDAEEKLETVIELSPSSLSVNYVCFDEDSSSRRPILVHETKWNIPQASPLSASYLLYRTEQHFVLMTAETLYVAYTTLFFDLALVNTVQIMESPIKEESSIVFSLHKCTSFIRRDDVDVDVGESGKTCKFVVLPSDVNFDAAVSDEDVNLLNDEESGREIIAINRNLQWNPFPSESSTDAYEGDKPEMGKIETFPERFRGKLERLTWLHSYESKPGEEVIRSSVRSAEKFDSVTPVVFRYVSSDGSNTSMKTEVHQGEVVRKLSQLFDVGLPEVEVQKNEENESLPRQVDNDDDDTSSTSSFKSSNDYSDVSDFTEVKQTKKKAKAKSHFLDKLFHELRSFRKSLTTKRRAFKRKDDRDFEEVMGEKQKVDEAVAVNTMCIDEVAIPAMPRKIFKTSFRGKESVTELMIDLKDVSISEVSDISVEKRKLATDHTKISIIISKQTATEGKDVEKEKKYSSQHSLHTEKQQCLGWDKEDNETKSDDDNDEDYVSVDSSTHSRSVENVLEKPIDTDNVRDDTAQPSWRQHKFDFYKKMDGAMSAFDSIAKMNGKQIFISSKYDRELAPLRKAITDMQVRVQNVHKKSFCTSPDEFYERALRMAKMSAGYCQSCKSKTVIPKDPLGIYQRFIPHDSYWKPATYGKHRKYYFKTTSSTNSSFYSIRSSSSDLSNKFCQLNSSSSFQANGVSTRSSLFPTRPETSTTQSTTSHHYHHYHPLPIMKYQLPSFPPA